MGSAANHFLSGGNKDQDANVHGAATKQSSPGAYGMWWNPAGASSHSADPASGVSSEENGGSGSRSIIPVDRDLGFSSGSLASNSLAPIGSHSSQQAYAILGLSTSSSPAVTSGQQASVVSFSLSGNVNLVPIDNLAAGGLSLSVVPEPSAAGLLAIGLAGIASMRRRKPLPAA
jgi:hypothetical protein